jgi:phosphogluconate dehydratase
VRDGDVIRLDAQTGQLNVLIPDDQWAEREVDAMPPNLRQNDSHGMGRELFTNMRRSALTAEEGALSWV